MAQAEDPRGDHLNCKEVRRSWVWVPTTGDRCPKIADCVTEQHKLLPVEAHADPGEYNVDNQECDKKPVIPKRTLVRRVRFHVLNGTLPRPFLSKLGNG